MQLRVVLRWRRLRIEQLMAQLGSMVVLGLVVLGLVLLVLVVFAVVARRSGRRRPGPAAGEPGSGTDTPRSGGGDRDS